MYDIKYIIKRRNRKKQQLRLRLGVLLLIHKPLLNLIFVPIIAGIVYLWIKKDIAYSFVDVPQILFPIYKNTITILLILLPLFIVIIVIEAIGNITAKKDEADLQEAFNQQELRNGCPILMNKKRVKGSNVIMREFYSSIPMKTWLDKQEEIADSMNIHFVEKLKYGGKSNGKRVVMYTAQGRRIKARDKLYDDEF